MLLYYLDPLSLSFTNIQLNFARVELKTALNFVAFEYWAFIYESHIYNDVLYLVSSLQP